MRISNGSFDLPDPEALYLAVVVKIQEKSMRSYIAESVQRNLDQNRDLYRDMIEVEARRLGLTWEQCFNLYAQYSLVCSQSIESAKNSKPTVFKQYGRKNS
jgi:hypothetical protein